MRNSLNSLLFSSFVLFFFITTSWGYDSHNDYFRCFHTNSQNPASISSVIHTQTNSSYQELWFSTIQNPRPASGPTLKPLAIITPVEESQISLIISCSKLYGIEIRARSGGHDYEGLSFISESPFIILDLRNLRSITINAEKKTVWAQTGVTLGELYYAIANTSKTLAFPAGVCPTVCVGGHISGGGFGMISRKFGLAIDHVVDVRIVDVNGRVLDRESMGEDFFWAIRGGGGASFGVILAWKLNLVSIPETVTVFNVTRTLEQNVTELVQRHLDIADKIDNNLVLRLFVRSTNDNVKRKTIRVAFKSVYLGGVENLLQLMQKNFLELGLTREDCTEMSWIESVVYIWMFPRDATPEVLLSRTKESLTYFKGKSDFLTEPIPKEGLLGLWKRLHEKTDEFELQITPYGGRMNEISEFETPFPHRLGTRYMMHYLVVYDQDEGVKEKDSIGAQRNIKWIRELYKYMGSYVAKNPRTAYLNYRDLDVGSDDEENASNKRVSIWGSKYFKNNFERLVQVKTKVDPINFFKNEQSIPVSHHFNAKDIEDKTQKIACDIKFELR